MSIMTDDHEDDDRTHPLGVRISSSRPSRPRDRERQVGLNRVIAAVLGDPAREIRFGDFIAERKYRQGGMGELYLGRHSETGEPVAIKVGRPADGGEINRLQREAKRLRALQHPNVVRYLDDGVSEDGAHFLVMEWLEGRDLAKLIRRKGPLSGADARALGIATARGLAAAHEANVIHRDVNPGNVFLVDQDCANVRVLDFGIARVGGGDDTAVTSLGIVVGTPSCMAPEQIEGRFDVRTDVYGLGATLYEALTGLPLFEGVTATDILLAVRSAQAHRVSDTRADVDPQLDDLIASMLSKQPDERPQSMQAVIDRLEGIESP